VTGGGIEGRLRFFCKHASVGIQVHSPLPTPDEVREIIALGNVDISEAYRTWNMGTGLVVVTDSTQAEAVLERAGIGGLNAQIIGNIIDEHTLTIPRYDGSTLLENLP